MRYNMPALTTEEIRNIADIAVAEVAREKITTTKVILLGHIASRNSSASTPSKISLAVGRAFFRDAFNAARKG